MQNEMNVLDNKCFVFEFLFAIVVDTRESSFYFFVKRRLWQNIVTEIVDVDRNVKTLFDDLVE